MTASIAIMICSAITVYCLNEQSVQGETLADDGKAPLVVDANEEQNPAIRAKKITDLFSNPDVLPVYKSNAQVIIDLSTDYLDPLKGMMEGVFAEGYNKLEQLEKNWNDNSASSKGLEEMKPAIEQLAKGILEILDAAYTKISNANVPGPEEFSRKVTDMIQLCQTPVVNTLITKGVQLFAETRNVLGSKNSLSKEDKKASVDHLNTLLKEIENNNEIRSLKTREHKKGHDEVLFEAYNIILENWNDVEDMLWDFLTKLLDGVEAFVKGSVSDDKTADAVGKELEALFADKLENASDSCKQKCLRWSQPVYDILLADDAKDRHYAEIHETTTTYKVIDLLKRYVLTTSYCLEDDDEIIMNENMATAENLDNIFRILAPPQSNHL